MSLTDFWSPTVLRVLGFRVRLHVFLLVLAAAEILAAALRTPPQAGEAAVGIGILMASILAAELARGMACRRMGGESDEITLWPLGSLSSARVPQEPRAHFWMAFWGPAVHAGIAALCALALKDRQALALGDPFAWGDPLRTAYRINLVLCLFNLIPAFPLAGGQMLRALLWSRRGFESATRISVRVGKVAAVLLAVAGVALESWVLVLLAILNFVACEQERRLLAEQPWGSAPEPWHTEWSPPAEPGWLDRMRAARRERKELERRAHEARLRGRVDAILERIHRVGMQGLTEEERRTLREASDVFRQNRP